MLPVGDLISLASISLAFSKSSQIGPSSSNHLKTVWEKNKRRALFDKTVPNIYEEPSIFVQHASNASDVSMACVDLHRDRIPPRFVHSVQFNDLQGHIHVGKIVGSVKVKNVFFVRCKRSAPWEFLPRQNRCFAKTTRPVSQDQTPIATFLRHHCLVLKNFQD